MQKYFIFYINLLKDNDRRANMENEFHRLNISAERLDATWWKTVPFNEANALYSIDLNKEQYYKPLSNGEKGCYASHIRVWKILLESDAEKIVVLEDDISLNDEFIKILDAIDKSDQKWDMIKLIGRERNEKIKSSENLLGTQKLIRYNKIPSCTTGYVLSRSGAKKLISSRIPFGRPIDIDLRFFWENDLKILGVHPAAISLADSSTQSSIWTTREKNSFRERMKKFKMKTKILFLNFLHN